MIGSIYEARKHWTQALVVSLMLHGVAAAAALDVLPSFPRPAPDTPLPEIEIASLEVEHGIATTTELQPVAPQIVQPVPSTTLPGGAQSVAAEVPPLVTPPDDMQGAISNVAPAPGAGRGEPDGSGTQIAGLPTESSVGVIAATAGASVETGARNAALADLITQLRQRLAEPCLAAMPQTLGGEEVQLTVLGAEDRSIADLFRDISGSVQVPMTERSVLLDTRQCPAVDFARAAVGYPAWPLRVQLDTGEIASGGRLVGRIGGFGDNSVSLLLVDDNGVVQDLRRFTLQSGDRLEFDVPVHRVDAPRDTSQLLLAVATPQRPDTIVSMDGRLAQDFFGALSDATNGGALVGIATFYVRGGN